ncbi:MAG TPA: PQQ-binding-like beta-propeller repeat protein [Anaerolineae bacterium]|nr:PQQ-binding-like beta-propeller repeat protein [Anaerolineae bacterium]HUW08451.1 PQQ-binding-like beta-propeller repeat protein [Anaerolineae bacterium]
MKEPIFCPACETLIKGQTPCPECGWRPEPSGKTPTGDETWGIETGGKVYSCPVAHAGLVYVTSRDGNVYAIDPDKGSVVWTFSMSPWVPSEGLDFWENKVLVGSTDMEPLGSTDKALFALHAKTGDEIWRSTTQSREVSAPAVAEDRVYFSSIDKKLHAVDAKTGSELWSSELPGYASGGPAVAEGVIYLGTRDNNCVCAVEATTGQGVWTSTTEGWVPYRPLVHRGTVYASSWDKNVYALEVKTGKERWRFAARKSMLTPPVFGEGRLFVGSQDRHLYCLDPATGEELWRFATGGRVRSAPAVWQGCAYFGSDDKVIYGVDIDNGKEIWRRETEGKIRSTPLVHRGKLLFGSGDRQIHAFPLGVPEEEAEEAEKLAPSTLVRRGEHLRAAYAYLQRGQFDKAGAMFDKVGEYYKSAECFREAGDWKRAARQYKEAKAWSKAKEAYLVLDDPANVAEICLRLGEDEEAAGHYALAGAYGTAAELYEKLGLLEQAGDMYQKAGDYVRAKRIYAQLGAHRRLAQLCLALGEQEEAASILEELQEWIEAAAACETAGQLARAAEDYLRGGQDDKAIDLFRQRGDLARVGQVCARLGRWLEAAEAYHITALTLEEQRDENQRDRLAELFERAAECYQRGYDEQNCADCRAKLVFYRRLPNLKLNLKANEGFMVSQADVLDMKLDNVGYGLAEDIQIEVSGDFEIRRAPAAVPGLLPGHHRTQRIYLIPLQSGPNVFLNFEVSYKSQSPGGERAYCQDFPHYVHVATSPLDKIAQMSVSGDVYLAPVKHIGGDELAPGAKKYGDVGMIREDRERATEKTTPEPQKELRRCPKCGEALEAHWTFCRKCLTRFAPDDR